VISFDLIGSSKLHFPCFLSVPIKVDMDVTLQDETFSEDLTDKSSKRYQKLATEFVEEVSLF
jgi:hypothetical protein